MFFIVALTSLSAMNYVNIIFRRYCLQILTIYLQYFFHGVFSIKRALFFKAHSRIRYECFEKILTSGFRF